MEGSPTGIAAGAAALLRSERVAFAPALATRAASHWTLRDALLAAVGCSRDAGPLAYWEWETLHAALQAARTVIAKHVDLPPNMDVERWANQPSRTLEEVLQALDAVTADEDEPAPPAPTLRPWCDPSTVSRCRIPYIPLAAVTHAWGDMDRPWSVVAQELDLVAEMTSWDLLRSVDPLIRDVSPALEVGDVAWDLRCWKTLKADSLSPARWLFSVTAEDSLVTLRDLRRRAHDEVRDAVPSV